MEKNYFIFNSWPYLSVYVFIIIADIYQNAICVSIIIGESKLGLLLIILYLDSRK